MKHLTKYLFIFLVVALTLSGCKLIKINEEADNAQVVAEFKGGAILKGEAMSQYEATVQQYAMYGITDASTLESIKPSILEYMVREEILKLKAEEMNLTELSDEELAELKADVAKRYEDSINQYIDLYKDSETTDEEAREAVIEMFEADGYTLEAAEESEIEGVWQKHLKEEVTKDITFTEDEIKAEYDEHVSADEQQYQSDPTAFENAMEDGELVAWHPAGYRTEKHILIPYTDEQISALSGLTSQRQTLQDQIISIDEQIAEGQAASEEETEGDEEDETLSGMDTGIDPDLPEEGELGEDAEMSDEALLQEKSELQTSISSLDTQIAEMMTEYGATLQGKVDEIMAKVQAGDDFDALIAEYGSDDSMEIENVKENGAYISANTTEKDKALVDAAMSLENIGDVGISEPGEDGIYIVRYISDVLGGAVDLESIRADIEEEVLTTLKDAHYEEMVTQWIEEADVKYYVDRMVYLQ